MIIARGVTVTLGRTLNAGFVLWPLLLVSPPFWTLVLPASATVLRDELLQHVLKLYQWRRLELGSCCMACLDVEVSLVRRPCRLGGTMGPCEGEGRLASMQGRAAWSAALGSNWHRGRCLLGDVVAGHGRQKKSMRVLRWAKERKRPGGGASWLLG